MDIKEQAEVFLAQKRIAVVGVSRQGGTGNGIFKGLQQRGYDMVPVNHHMTQFQGGPCYPNLAAIPGGIDAAIIVTKPEETELIAQECIDAGFPMCGCITTPCLAKITAVFLIRPLPPAEKITSTLLLEDVP